jgi:hypothetical protein
VWRRKVAWQKNKINGIVSEIEISKETAAKGGMSLEDMERGYRDAGKADARAMFAAVLDRMEFDAPLCPECKAPMVNMGRGDPRVMARTGVPLVHPALCSCPDGHAHASPLEDFIGLPEQGGEAPKPPALRKGLASNAARRR